MTSYKVADLSEPIFSFNSDPRPSLFLNGNWWGSGSHRGTLIMTSSTDHYLTVKCCNLLWLVLLWLVYWHIETLGWTNPLGLVISHHKFAFHFLSESPRFLCWIKLEHISLNVSVLYDIGFRILSANWNFCVSTRYNRTSWKHPAPVVKVWIFFFFLRLVSSAFVSVSYFYCHCLMLLMNILIVSDFDHMFAVFLKVCLWGKFVTKLCVCL